MPGEAEPGWETLVGTRIRRIDSPWEGLWSLSLAGPSTKLVLLVGLPQDARGVAITPSRPKGRPATAWVQKLRKEAEGARISALAEEPDGTIRLTLSRGEGRLELVFELVGRDGNLVILDDDRRVVLAVSERGVGQRSLSAGEPYVPPPVGKRRHLSGPSWTVRDAHADALVHASSGRELGERKRLLLKSLKRERSRLQRRLSAVQGDAKRATACQALRQEADLLLAHLHAVRKGAGFVDVLDYNADPPVQRRIEVDARVGPKVQAERMYARARRLERGARLATARMQATTDALDRLLALEQDAAAAESEGRVEELHEAAWALGVPMPVDQTAPARKKQPEGRLPYRQFAILGDRVALVGRGAADNDALTLRHSRPADLWLHARGQRGAHVIVPMRRGQSCSEDTLVDAATLAAHFSDARGEPVVEVQYAERRHVRKPRGTAPGAVMVDREKVLAVRLEKDRLERLLASERSPRTRGGR